MERGCGLVDGVSRGERGGEGLCMKESQSLEFKKSLAEAEQILETISAFANAKGGKILVGIEENKDGTIKEVVGVVVKGKEIENLTNEIKQNTDPIIFPSIELEKMDGKDVLAIEVRESFLRPAFSKGKGFKRVGRSNIRLSVQEIRHLTKESINISFTDEVFQKASLQDIDWGYVEDIFIPLYESITKQKMKSDGKELLLSLRVITTKKPTVAGLLLFGKDSQHFFLNAYIALAIYRGKVEGVERLDYKEFSGKIFEQIDSCAAYIKGHIAVMSRLHPYQVQREDIPEYGLFSIRELITNAVCHRDYAEPGSKVIVKMFSDRIEIYNPGGLPKDITPKNISQKQYSRNPVIANVLAKVKYIEEVGEGWNKILDEHKMHPLHPSFPKIVAEKESVLVTLFSTKEKFEVRKERHILTERQKNILRYLRREERVTASSCARLLEVSNDTALRELSHLRKLQLIKKKGIGRGVYYTLP